MEPLLQLKQDKVSEAIQANISQFIVFLRDDRKSSSSTIKSYVAGLKHFYDMNEITTLNWRKINRYQPEHRACVEDRPYTQVFLLEQNITGIFLLIRT
jgi:hypothetical protein